MKWNISLILFCTVYLGFASNAQRNGDLRLTDGNSGQLEVYFNGWGFICDDGWGSVDANTTCKILGYGTAVTSAITQYNASRNYKLNFIDCIGNETSILDCGYRTYVAGHCSSYEHIYIECGYVNGDLRLAGGDSGLVEVYYNGWGYICDDGWDTVDSNTICQILGYGAAISTTIRSYHVSRNYKLDFISCTGNESSILDCDYREYTPNYCSQDEHVNVTCGPANGEIRLTGGFRGLLEVYYDGWGFVCDDGWGSIDANTTCKILGYESSITTSIGRYNASRNYKINFIDCSGSETSFLDCNHQNYTPNYCSAYEHIYIECGPVNGDVRLTEGDSGLLEVYYNGWGFICDDRWGTVDANTVCILLGHDAVNSTRIGRYHSSTDYKLNYIDCTGNETSILDCGYREYRPNFCSQSEHIYISCSPAHGELRLTGGFSGLLEVFYNGWGYICDDGWGTVDSNTICQILGYGAAISTTTSSYHVSRNYKLNYISCTGNESSILYCGYREYVPNFCSQNEHVYVTCGPANGAIRLTGGFNGLLEIYYNGWGFICDDGWDALDANTTCKILGYETAITTSIGRYNASTNYKINFIECLGTETNILDCNYRLYSLYYCSASEHIYLECGPINGDLRLAGGDSGLVEVYYNGWGYICDDGWDTVDSNTICQILGYGAAESTTTSSYHVSRNYKLNFISCTGTESSILDCGYREYVPNFCARNEHVNITCGPAYGHIRLANKDSGVLEIYLNQWGYVCDDGWNRIASEVVCRQLGLDRLISFETGVEVNDLLYPFLIDDVECNGNESTIFECTHTLRHNCGSGEHVSITCGSNQTMTIPATSTTTIPTTSTISTSTFITTSSSIGITPKITSPGMNITKTLNVIVTDIPSIECAATGDPTPDIYWSRDLTTKFIDSPILQINITDLSTNRDFYCVAENSAGRDVVSVTFKIVLTKEEITNTLEGIMDDLDEVDSFSDDESGQTADIIKVVIDASNDNVDIEGEEKSKILENAAMTAQTIIEKTNGTFSNETSERITGLLSSIVNGSSEIQQSQSTVSQQREESAVATVPLALAITLNTLEIFSKRLSEELANSELNFVNTIVSQLITIVIQNVELESSENGERIAEIELPVKNSDDVEYSVMITLSTNLAAILSTNGKSLPIATSIVKRIEVKESDFSQPTQGSDILTVALPGKFGIVELTENIILSFDVYSNQLSESTCVFLNGTSWVSDGLSTDQTTTNLTNCESSHLTSFAVFVTPYKNSKRYIESIVLSAISYLFVGISFIFLLISLILFLMTGKAFFKVEANIIYFNYCLSMLLATGLFVFGIQVGTYNNEYCHIIAFLLHYSWLSVFTWTLCIGIFIMYKIVINVLSSKKIYKYLIIFGWVFPLLIPVITIAVARDQYVDVSSHCFLNVTGGIIWAFIGPILTMVLINAVFLISAVIQIIQTQSSAQNNETRNIVKNALITGLVLTPVLGLPWIILIFNVTIQHSVLEWIFIIINSAMGLVFFLVVVLRNKEVLTRFKRKKEIVFSNAYQSTQQTAPSSSIPSFYTSNRFKETDTLEKYTMKLSEKESASIDDPPVSQDISQMEMVTEVQSNPIYMQSPNAGNKDEVYISMESGLTESDTRACINSDEAGSKVSLLKNFIL